MNNNLNSVVLVGIDGSPEALVAVQWAAREAERRHQGVRLVHAFTEPLVGFEPGVAFPTGLTDALSRASTDLLSTAAEAVRTAHPYLDVQIFSVHGEPRRVLRSESEKAALTVVGTHGRGRIPEVVLGSV